MHIVYVDYSPHNTNFLQLITYDLNTGMTPEQRFGAIIKKIRESKSISQEKLAQLSKLDRTFISQIENGKRNPTLVTILKISKALDVEPAFLFKQYVDPKV